VLQEQQPIILLIKDLDKISSHYDRFSAFKKEVDKLRGRVIVIACT
jgi:hypothetical protein